MPDLMTAGRTQPRWLDGADGSKGPVRPRDLAAYKKTEGPKLKKDYGGQLIRVNEMPLLSGYERNDEGRYEMAERKDPLFADGTVFKLRRRIVDGGKPRLACDRDCPLCGHRHERVFPEYFIDEGRAEFVEADGFEARGDALYLAAPYSHPDKAVRQARWLAASRAAAWLMKRGYAVLSPLSMGHPVSVLGEDLGLGGDFAAWRETNLTMLAMSDYLVVLLLEGAEESVGVRAEAAFAREKGIPVWAMRDGESYEPPRPLFEFEEVSL